MNEKRIVLERVIMNPPTEWDEELAAGEQRIKKIRDKLAAKCLKGTRFEVEPKGVYLELVCYREVFDGGKKD